MIIFVVILFAALVILMLSINATVFLFKAVLLIMATAFILSSIVSVWNNQKQ